MSRPDREAFLRRLEEQRQQQERTEDPPPTPTTSPSETTRDDEFGEKAPLLRSTKSDTDAVAANVPTKKSDPAEDETLRYLKEQCGITDLHSLESFDASSLELLRQLTPQRKTSPVESSRPEVAVGGHEPQKSPAPRSDGDDERESENRRVATSGVVLASLGDVANDDYRAHVTDLVETLDRHQRLIESTSRRIDDLERELVDLRARLGGRGVGGSGSGPRRTATTTIPAPANGVARRARERVARVRARLDATVLRLSRTRTARALRLAHREARRQNIHANLDVTLLIKMLFMVVFFGGGQSGGGGDRDENRYRTHALVLAVLIIYSLQTGVLGFLYRFLTHDLKRLEREEAGEHDNDDAANEGPRDARPGDPIVIGFRRRAPAADEMVPPRPPPPTTPPPPQRRNGLINGAISPDDGVLHDVKFLLAGFVLSLIPTWKPVKAEVAPNADESTRGRGEGGGSSGAPGDREGAAAATAAAVARAEERANLGNEGEGGGAPAAAADRQRELPRSSSNQQDEAKTESESQKHNDAGNDEVANGAPAQEGEENNATVGMEEQRD